MSASVVSRVVGLGALTAAGQLVIIGALPFYSRIFDPDVYGHYVIFVGLFTILSVFAGLRYDSAIVLPRDDKVAGYLSGLVVLLGGVVSALVVTFTYAASTVEPEPVIVRTLGVGFGYGLAAATLVGSVQRSLVGWCVRGGRFISLGGAQFTFCVISTLAQLSFAYIMPKMQALVWGYVLGLASQTAFLAWGVGFPLSLGLRSNSWTRPLRVVARRYRRFPTYMVGYALASTVRDRLVQLVLGLGAGAGVVGRFGLAQRVTFAPNSLIYSAVSPVFFSLASRGDRSSVGRFAGGLVEAGFVILLVPYVAFAIEASELTDTLLGEKWHGTGPYVQALAAPALLLAATCWLDRAFDSFRRQSVAFSLEATFTVVAVFSVALAARYFEGIVATWIFGAISLIYYWLYFLVTFLACGFPLADFRRACTVGVLVLGGTLAAAAIVHRLPNLEVRFAAYSLLMLVVSGVWFKWLGGAESMRLLVRSRVYSASK